ncbi:MAG TPA: hypothetical protein VNJ31_08420, partial [Methyloceanibacter sp.]|nr:hypothetical protein [Methyloceanibacter sp.]
GGAMQVAIRSLLESGQTPVGYARQSLSDCAHYYAAGKGARSMVVLFSGLTRRPGVPISCFLQSLRDDLYDVLMLQDPKKLHFDSGVPGFGSSFLELARRIEAFAETKGYTEIITYGVSMGGYPALRAGILLGAKRAISIGGTYVWHVGRLIRNEPTSKAFDLLCPCYADTKTELVSVVAAKQKNDLRALEILQATFPKCVAIKVNTDQHVVVAFFLRTHLLRLFHACLFEYWHDTTVRSGLLAIAEDAANHIQWIEMRGSPNHKRQVNVLQQRLEQIQRSLSWRLTKPLRDVGSALRRLGLGRRP